MHLINIDNFLNSMKYLLNGMFKVLNGRMAYKKAPLRITRNGANHPFYFNKTLY